MIVNLRILVNILTHVPMTANSHIFFLIELYICTKDHKFPHFFKLYFFKILLEFEKNNHRQYRYHMTPMSYQKQWEGSTTLSPTEQFHSPLCSALLLLLYKIRQEVKPKKNIYCIFISLDKMLFFPSKIINIFLICPQKHMLWVLIRSASARCF